MVNQYMYIQAGVSIKCHNTQENQSRDVCGIFYRSS